MDAITASDERTVGEVSVHHDHPETDEEISCRRSILRSNRCGDFFLSVGWSSLLSCGIVCRATKEETGIWMYLVGHFPFYLADEEVHQIPPDCILSGPARTTIKQKEIISCLIGPAAGSWFLTSDRSTENKEMRSDSWNHEEEELIGAHR